jgi:hypothetical protein
MLAPRIGTQRGLDQRLPLNERARRQKDRGSWIILRNQSRNPILTERRGSPLPPLPLAICIVTFQIPILSLSLLYSYRSCTVSVAFEKVVAQKQYRPHDHDPRLLRHLLLCETLALPESAQSRHNAIRPLFSSRPPFVCRKCTL